MRVNKSNYDKEMRLLKTAMDGLAEAALAEFIKNTPVKTGNARRRTRLENEDTIVANYPYAQKLDEGYSKQSPAGMVKPTEDWIEAEVTRRLRRLNHGQ